MTGWTFRAAIVLVLCATALAGYHAGAQRMPAQGEANSLKIGEVMRVGDRVITAEELIARVWDFETALQPKEKVLEPSLSYLRDTAALELEAERMGVTISEAEIDAVSAQQLEAIKAKVKQDSRGMMTYEQWLQQQGLTKEGFEKYVRDRSPIILKKRLLVIYFEESEPSITCSHILVTKLATARQIHKQLEEAEKNGRDVKALFEDLAATRSEDPSSSLNRGRLPRIYRNDGTLVESVAKACWDLDDGSFSEPVKSGFGYHILMRHQTLTPEKRPFDEMREEIMKMPDVDEVRFNRWVRWVFNTQGYEVDRRLPGFDVKPDTQTRIRPARQEPDKENE